MTAPATRKRLLSGIQPTGEIHIGNYLGAIKNWVALMESHESLFCIVDYHALTVEYDVEQFASRIRDAFAVNIACGLDPEKCIVFVQSQVPEHTELAWIFNSVTQMGELSKMTQFKDKSQKGESSNVGLFTYPVLQAADILVYKASVVPVGEDQAQHIELCRDIARRFNFRFKREVFPEAQTLHSEAKRIMGLDGERKMSKSVGNTIPVIAEPEPLAKLVRTAVTDTNRVRKSDPGNPDICNVFTSFHRFFTPKAQQDEIREGCTKATLGCTDCKAMCAANISAELAPINARYHELKKNPSTLDDMIRSGGAKARAIAQATMHEVREALGIGGIPR
jgi:tryptophanyl-tRNA synthetase